ncbi:unnamed protein product [Ixodes hexagonus]
MKCDTGGLTREIHAALEQTSYSLVKLSQYCLETLNFKYVLLGKFLTDCLEDRFGRYRRLAGAQYQISVRQKMLMLVPPLDTIDEEEAEDEDQSVLNVLITENDLQSSQCDMPVIAYVAGYSHTEAHAL